MMARRGVLGALIGGTALVLGGCGLSGNASYRFRMTVEARTPQGLSAGSSVMEVVAMRGFRLGDRAGGGSTLTREAVVVDLPNGPIFVLLRSPDAGPALQGPVTDTLNAHRVGDKRTGDFVDDVRAVGGWFGGAQAELPREDWPLMVRFRDLDDPTSVERVEPEAVGIRRILLETTGDEVTVGIKKWLEWLNDLDGYRTDLDNPFTNTLPQEIGYLRSGVA